MTTRSREKATVESKLAPAADDVSASQEGRGRIARAAPWLAGLWVGFYVPMATLHLIRDTPPPWTHTPASALAALSSEQVSALIIVLGLVVAATLATITSRRDTGRRRAAGWLLVGVGLVVMLAVSDTRALSFVGYGPMLLLGLLGVGPVPEEGIEGSVIAASLLAVGSTLGGIGMLLTGARVLSRRGGDSRFGTARQALRIGRWAVSVAVLIPLSYAVTRLAWAVGVPLGVRDEFLVELGAGKWAGFGLGAFAVVGCLLTLGLVQRWGEVFWSWVPVIGGRPVPVGMAVVPAMFVAAIVTSAGTAFWGSVLAGNLADLPGAEQDWATWAPELLWPLWGVALAVAALAYRHRRTTVPGARP